MKPTLVLASLIAASLATPAFADGGSRMYKCVDQTGKVYYSDKLNPDCGQGAEMNRQGVVLNKKDVTKVASKPGQPAGPDPIVAQKNAKDQERRDRALMATYTSEEEIDAARDRSLQIPALGIKAGEAKLEKLNVQLTGLKKQADALAAQKKALPPSLLEDVSNSQKEIAGVEADLTKRKRESDAIRAKFDADKARFRELSGTSAQAAAK